MSALQSNKYAPAPRVITLPSVTEIPSCEADFLPELHGIRSAAAMVTLFGETMTTKTAHTADAKQKRGK